MKFYPSPARLGLALVPLLGACIVTAPRDPRCAPAPRGARPLTHPAAHPVQQRPLAREASYAYAPTFGSGAPRLELSLGQRSLDTGDYEPVEDQVALGLGLSQEVPGSAFGWELGFMGSYDDDPVSGIGEVEGRTAELYGGLRKTLSRRDSAVRPYLGGGLSLVAASFEVAGIDDEDGSIAAYAHAGVEIEVSPSFAVGLDLRGLFGSDIELFGVETDADYTQLAVFLALVL